MATFRNTLIGSPVLDLFLDCLLDAALDTLRLVPFLLVTYFALVALEYKAGAKTREVVARAGASGPAIGAMLGAVPQCGFSAAAAMLYAGRVITLGTLFAVFLSTSDEMLPLMIAQQADPGLMVQLVLLKVALGMVTGFLVDLAIRVLGIKVQGMGAEFVGSDEPEIFQLDSGSIIAIYPDGSATLDGDPFDLEALLAQANEEEGLSLEEIEEAPRASLRARRSGARPQLSRRAPKTAPVRFSRPARLTLKRADTLLVPPRPTPTSSRPMGATRAPPWPMQATSRNPRRMRPMPPVTLPASPPPPLCPSLWAAVGRAVPVEPIWAGQAWCAKRSCALPRSRSSSSSSRSYSTSSWALQAKTPLLAPSRLCPASRSS